MLWLRLVSVYPHPNLSLAPSVENPGPGGSGPRGRGRPPSDRAPLRAAPGPWAPVRALEPGPPQATLQAATSPSCNWNWVLICWSTCASLLCAYMRSVKVITLVTYMYVRSTVHWQILTYIEQMSDKNCQTLLNIDQLLITNVKTGIFFSNGYVEVLENTPRKNG